MFASLTFGSHATTAIAPYMGIFGSGGKSRSAIGRNQGRKWGLLAGTRGLARTLWNRCPFVPLPGTCLLLCLSARWVLVPKIQRVFLDPVRYVVNKFSAHFRGHLRRWQLIRPFSEADSRCPRFHLLIANLGIPIYACFSSATHCVIIIYKTCLLPQFR